MPDLGHTIIHLARALYGEPEGFIPLHAPHFSGNERKYVMDCIDSTFVSSVGEYVGRFEEMLAASVGVRRAVACVNGTAALEVALRLAGVERDEMVVTQALSFVATANAISHCGAVPAFVDVEPSTLGMSPAALSAFLESDCEKSGGAVRHRATGRRVAACVPMHTFGHPCRIDEIVSVAAGHGVPVVEDAAESLGSLYRGRHTGAFGVMGTLSFNGNKICTAGGGGAILIDDDELADRARRLTTTAKLPHAWEFKHDMVAWNYRLTNLSAALACAQLERLDEFVDDKRLLADEYASGLAAAGADGSVFVREPAESRSNYWLNAVMTADRRERDHVLAATNRAGVMTRPAWEPLHLLPMYAGCPRGGLDNTVFLADRLVNIPSSPRPRGARK